MSKQYSLEQIKIMNLSYPWNNSIKPKPDDLKTSSNLVVLINLQK